MVVSLSVGLAIPNDKTYIDHNIVLIDLSHLAKFKVKAWRVSTLCVPA